MLQYANKSKSNLWFAFIAKSFSKIFTPFVEKLSKPELPAISGRIFFPRDWNLVLRSNDDDPGVHRLENSLVEILVSDLPPVDVLVYFRKKELF